MSTAAENRQSATPGETQNPVVDVNGLGVSFATLRGRLPVLEDVSFSIQPGEIVGLVGESGSGKSVTALALMGLLGQEGRVDSGTISLDGQDLRALNNQQMLAIRGREISMVFQEPMTSLNPVYTVGFQIAEVLIEHFGQRRRAALAQAAELMKIVGIPDAHRRVHDYPHQLSGGMRQRVMIAMAMACQPKLLIADEPTTALDVTIQAQILDLLRELRDQFGTAVLMITHDMGVIASVVQRVIVMYAGHVVEVAPVEDLFSTPAHPYTRLLLRSIPRVQQKRAQLESISGTPPSPTEFPTGCRFHPRCPDALETCRGQLPALDGHGVDRAVRCWRAGEKDLQSALPA